MKGKLFADSEKYKYSPFDGLLGTMYSSEADECFFGLDVGEGRVVKISSIRYLPNPDWSVRYLRGAVVEGSNDMSSWTEIFEVDINAVHSGWNYF